MDPEKRRLIDQLCTQAGMIVEDCSAAAITSRDIDEQELSGYVNKLAADTYKGLYLIVAAQDLANS